jgi:hypothetical protein
MQTHTHTHTHTHTLTYTHFRIGRVYKMDYLLPMSLLSLQIKDNEARRVIAEGV